MNNLFSNAQQFREPATVSKGGIVAAQSRKAAEIGAGVLAAWRRHQRTGGRQSEPREQQVAWINYNGRFADRRVSKETERKPSFLWPALKPFLSPAFYNVTLWSVALDNADTGARTAQ
jgi:hypothetical protein